MPIIKNYGLRWARDKIRWTRAKPGDHGKLPGKLVGSKRSDPTDFAQQIGVYILFEPGYVPIYIGQAGNGNADLFSRLKHHCEDHLRDRWSHFSWFGFKTVGANGKLHVKQRSHVRVTLPYGEALDEIEGILIQVLEPRLNRRGPNWRKTAEEYVQAGLKDENMRLEDIAEQLELIDERIARFEE
jgi:hypothetical protein